MRGLYDHGLRHLNTRHRGLPFSDREDVLQDSLIDLARNKGRIDNAEAFLTVIIDRTAATRAVQLTQLRENETPVGDTRQQEWENYHPATTIASATFAADFDAGVRGLPEPLRDAFIAIDIRGLSQDEAAVALGVPQRTLSRRIDLARDLMKEALA
jgi:DNA-directed RNA polymerase specialized sigma24 family protein